MRVLVSDASVLIDLEHGSLLEASFRLPFQFVVPDLLYKNELENYNGKELKKLGLSIEELDENSVTRAYAFQQQAPSLSLPDSFALALAQDHECILLTGDARLRELAENENVECHGVLWILDNIYDTGKATARELHDGLMDISNHPKSRLPEIEIRARLTRYAGRLS